MASDDDTAARFLKRAEELRADAFKTADPKMREMLLKLAKACEEMSTWTLRKAEER